MKSYRQWLYQILENHNYDFISRLVNIALVLLIVSNVLVIIASSEPELNQRFHRYFFTFEIFSLVIFTIEYLLRVWVSIEAGQSRLKYIFTPMAIIDLLAIAPSFLLLFGNDLLILRTLRLVRVFKLSRYSRSMDLLITVSKQEAETIFSAIFVLWIMIVISATGIHLVEGEIQPEEFGSIPRALWWATVTLTTVGYGDVVPITVAGRVLGIVIVITGIGMAALPAGILASGFTSEVNRRREQFKSKVMNRIIDGKISKKDRARLETLRRELGIGHNDAKLMIYEARNEAKMISHIDCPHCGNNIHLHHSIGHVKKKKEARPK